MGYIVYVPGGNTAKDYRALLDYLRENGIAPSFPQVPVRQPSTTTRRLVGGPPHVWSKKADAVKAAEELESRTRIPLAVKRWGGKAWLVFLADDRPMLCYDNESIVLQPDAVVGIEQMNGAAIRGHLCRNVLPTITDTDDHERLKEWLKDDAVCWEAIRYPGVE